MYIRTPPQSMWHGKMASFFDDNQESRIPRLRFIALGVTVVLVLAASGLILLGQNWTGATPIPVPAQPATLNATLSVPVTSAASVNIPPPNSTGNVVGDGSGQEPSSPETSGPVSKLTQEDFDALMAATDANRADVMLGIAKKLFNSEKEIEALVQVFGQVLAQSRNIRTLPSFKQEIGASLAVYNLKREIIQRFESHEKYPKLSSPNLRAAFEDALIAKNEQAENQHLSAMNEYNDLLDIEKILSYEPVRATDSEILDAALDQYYNLEIQAPE